MVWLRDLARPVSSGRSGTQGGTRGTPEPGPNPDLDVPTVLSLSCDSRFHWAGNCRVIPSIKNCGCPRLITNLRDDVRSDLYNRSIAEERSESLTL